MPETIRDKKENNKLNAYFKNKQEDIATPNLSKEKPTESNKIVELEEKIQKLQNKISHTENAYRLISYSRNRFAQLFDSAPISYFIFDETGIIDDVNVTGAKLLNVEKILLHNKPFVLYLTPEFHRIFNYHVEEVFQSNERQYCELKIRRKDESYLFVHVESIAIEDVENNKLCFSAFFDITKQKQFQKELKTSEQNFRRLFENLQDVFFRTDRNGKILLASPSTETLLGYSLNNLIGFDEKKLFKSSTDWFELNERLNDTGFIEGYETKMIKKDNVEIWVSINAQLFIDEKGKIIGTEKIIRDFTNYKKTSKTNKRLAEVIEKIPYFVSIIDPNGNNLYINQAGKDLLGISHELNINDYSINDFFDDSFVKKLNSEILIKLKNNGEWSGTSIIKNTAGKYLKINMKMFSNLDEYGNFDYYGTVITDISEKLNNENKLQAYQNRMYNSNKLFNTVQTTFSIIFNIIQFQQSDDKIDSKNNNSILNLIDDDISLINNLNNYCIHTKRIDVKHLIKNIVDKFNSSEELEISLKTKNKIPKMQIDNVLLEHIIVNMITIIRIFFSNKQEIILSYKNNKYWAIEFLTNNSATTVKTDFQKTIFYYLCELIMEKLDGNITDNTDKPFSVSLKFPT